MPTRYRLGFVDDDVVTRRERIGSRQPRDAGTDDSKS